MSHATVLLLVLLLLRAVRPDAKDDTDAAPFLIFIEHSDGYRCAASLVSQRTVVTSERCARGEGARGDVFARASGATRVADARRVARRALAGDGGGLAVLELEQPFAPSEDVRPILLAVEAAECRRTATCNAVRVLPGSPRRRLRVVDMTRAQPAVCSARFPLWASQADAQLCLSGDDICEQDLGGGVVCGGRLCGVLSAVATHGGGGGAGGGCGNVYVAQNVVYWRRFLHCAHTIRQCGRGSCKELCVEEQLLKEESETSAIAVTDTVARTVTNAVTVTVASVETEADTEPDTVATAEAVTPTRTVKTIDHGPVATLIITRTSGLSGTARSLRLPMMVPAPSPRPSTEVRRTPQRTRALLALPSSSPLTLPSPATLTPASPLPISSPTDELPSMRPVPEFEPNRADFRGGPSRTGCMPLKAGEYGDNAAEYGVEEPPPPGRSRPPPAGRTPRAPPPSPPSMPALRLPAPTPPAADAASPSHYLNHFHTFVVFIACHIFFKLK